jgi:hypothetical protein
MDRLFTYSAFGRSCARIQFESEGISFLADCIKE